MVDTIIDFLEPVQAFEALPQMQDLLAGALLHLSVLVAGEPDHVVMKGWLEVEH